MAEEKQEQQQYSSISGCLVRVFWAMVGPALVGAAGLGLILNKAPLGSVLDFVLLGGVIALIGARLLDPAKPDPTKPDSGDFGNITPRKYITWVLVIAVALFVVAHFVAPKLF